MDHFPRIPGLLGGFTAELESAGGVLLAVSLLPLCEHPVAMNNAANPRTLRRFMGTLYS
jgi:hypothetical protein